MNLQPHEDRSAAGRLRAICRSNGWNYGLDQHPPHIEFVQVWIDDFEANFDEAFKTLDDTIRLRRAASGRRPAYSRYPYQLDITEKSG